jgi:Divergent InlB B-repeat domain
MLGRVSGSTAASRSRHTLGLLSLVLGFLVLSGAAGAVGEQGGATGTLIVYVGGPAPAQVSVSPTPPPSDDGSGRHPCVQVVGDNVEDTPCVYTLPQGPVTLTAQFSSPPAPERRFLGWSDGDCGSSPVCETTLTASHAVVASFSPVKLKLQLDGAGKVTATTVPGGRVDTCTSDDQNPNPICTIEYDTITEVELEGTPTDGHVQWNEVALCDFGADPQASRCRALVNFDPFPVGVGFGEAPNPPGNFDIDVMVRVLFGGEGSGRVTGVRTAAPAQPIFNCAPDCSASIQYQRRVALTADPDADSTFEGWRGVCSTNPRCEFNAGAVTSVRAIFGRKPPNPPPPQPPPQPQPRRAFATQILGVRVIRTRRARVVVARVAVNEAASGRGQVRRGRRTLARRAFRLRSGRNVLRMPLRARVRRGRAWFAITLTSATGTTKSMRTRIFIPRRR